MTDAIAPVWVRQGTILSATVTWEQNNLQEPRVLYRSSGCQILSSPCFGMWYTGGWPGSAIGYAESSNGKTGWTKYASNPVLNGHFRGNVVHDGSTLYEFTANTSTGNMDLYTSPDSDGINWTLAASNIISKGCSGAFYQTAIKNSSVINDGGTWEMIYEGQSGSAYQCGSATASSPSGTWTKSGSNPVITAPGCSGPWIQKVGSAYWVWAGAAIPSPSYGFGRWTASSFSGTFVQNPASSTYYGGAVFSSGSSDEAPSPGGIADGWRLETGGSTYLYYAATNDENNSTGNAHIKLAIASYSVSTLITSIEGMTSSTP